MYALLITLIGHLTAEMFWSMIEMGLSVVAACLPTLRPIAKKIKPGYFRSTFWSIFSRESVSSLLGRQSHRSERTHRHYDNFSSTSETTFVPKAPFRDPTGTEAFAMRDLEAQTKLEPGSIMVHNNFSRNSEPKLPMI